MVRKSRALITFLLLAGTFLLSSTPASGQISKVGEVTLAPNESARGVSYEWPYAYVSLFDDGIQWKVDLSNPALPVAVTSFNPSFGDAWNENFYTQGMLVCGHRYGGLNLWDVTGAPAQLDTTATNYHYAGLDSLAAGSMNLLFYSEHNASGNPAGIHIYDIAGGTLNFLGDNLMGGNMRDGRFLKVTSDSWLYQLDGAAGSTRPLNLNIYNVTNPNAPIYSSMFWMGNTPGAVPGSADLALDPTERILYAACGYDGLRMLDIGIRPSPVVVNTLGAPGAYVEELSYLPGTTYMVVSVGFINNTQWRCHVLDCSNPQNPALIFNWFGDPGFKIFDIRAVQFPPMAAVLIVGMNAAGDAVLQVWR
jgi:hypothetical protein